MWTKGSAELLPILIEWRNKQLDTPVLNLFFSSSLKEDICLTFLKYSELQIVSSSRPGIAESDYPLM